MRTLKRASVLIATLALMGTHNARAFDTGHHWEVTSQVLREMGFSDDARKTVCVSNWMLDYYSSSPTGSKQVREELSKLHCDNLGDSKAVKRYLERFMANAHETFQHGGFNGNPMNDRETLLLLGAVLHVVQDLYSHSNWPELFSDENTLSDQTWFQTDGHISPKLITGAYHPPEYVAGQIPCGHPEHGSYEGGLHKDSHDRTYWPQAYFLSYCATYEFMEYFKSWVPKEKWDRLMGLKLLPPAKLELIRETKAAYGISQWIEVEGEHGHWKGGESGSQSLFLKDAIQFIASISRNSRWYRAKRGYSPLVKGLYDEADPPVTISFPGRISLQRRAFILKVTHAHEIGDHLDRLPFYGEPDLYLSGGVFYGKSERQKGRKLLLKSLYVKVEPVPPVEGEINVVFRDRVRQEASEVTDPWEILVIADTEKLGNSGNILSFYLNVGDEDPRYDSPADVSASPLDRGVLIHYDVAANRVILPDSGGKVSQGGRGKKIVIRGDQEKKSVELEFELYEMPVK